MRRFLGHLLFDNEQTFGTGNIAQFLQLGSQLGVFLMQRQHAVMKCCAGADGLKKDHLLQGLRHNTDPVINGAVGHFVGDVRLADENDRCTGVLAELE